MIEQIIFYLFATLAIGTAIVLVSIKNTARALFLFFVVLFALAALYLFALADFVAITQILVYVGGVLILMIFAFMLSNKEILKDMQGGSGRLLSLPNWQSLLLVLGFFGVIGFGIWDWHAQIPDWIEDNIRRGKIIQPTDNNVSALGIRFMSDYVLPFEVVSVLLMMTLMGAAHIARKGEASQ